MTTIPNAAELETNHHLGTCPALTNHGAQVLGRVGVEKRRA